MLRKAFYICWRLGIGGKFIANPEVSPFDHSEQEAADASGLAQEHKACKYLITSSLQNSLAFGTAVASDYPNSAGVTTKPNHRPRLPSRKPKNSTTNK
jgi:hypothetical protein